MAFFEEPAKLRSVSLEENGLLFCLKIATIHAPG